MSQPPHESDGVPPVPPVPPYAPAGEQQAPPAPPAPPTDAQDTTPYGTPQPAPTSPYGSPQPDAAAPYYGTQPAPPAPYGAYGAPQPSGPGKGLAITALVLGIVGFLGIAVAFIPFLGFGSLLVPLAAIVIGIIALVRKTPGRGLALTGLILGAVSLIACAAIAIAMSIFTTQLINDPGIGDNIIQQACEDAGLTPEECDEYITE